jgi:hypothetical protein
MDVDFGSVPLVSVEVEVKKKIVGGFEVSAFSVEVSGLADVDLVAALRIADEKSGQLWVLFENSDRFFGLQVLAPPPPLVTEGEEA